MESRFCTECECTFSKGSSHHQLPDELVLFRLVRDEAGHLLPWGRVYETEAPAALVCDRCLGRLPRHSPVVLDRREIQTGGRIFGWPYYASRYYAPGALVQEILPNTYRHLSQAV